MFEVRGQKWRVNSLSTWPGSQSWCQFSVLVTRVTIMVSGQAPLSTQSSRLIFSYRRAMSLKASGPLKLELVKGGFNCPTWVLRTKLWYSTREIYAFYGWPVSPGTELSFPNLRSLLLPPFCSPVQTQQKIVDFSVACSVSIFFKAFCH